MGIRITVVVIIRLPLDYVSGLNGYLSDEYQIEEE